MEILRNELQIVADNAPKGSHKKVAEIAGYSEQYIQQIRVGECLKVDNTENRDLMQDIINTYRDLIRVEQRKLAAI